MSSGRLTRPVYDLPCSPLAVRPSSVPATASISSASRYGLARKPDAPVARAVARQVHACGLEDVARRGQLGRLEHDETAQPLVRGPGQHGPQERANRLRVLDDETTGPPGISGDCGMGPGSASSSPIPRPPARSSWSLGRPPATSRGTEPGRRRPHRTRSPGRAPNRRRAAGYRPGRVGHRRSPRRRGSGRRPRSWPPSPVPWLGWAWPSPGWLAAMGWWRSEIRLDRQYGSRAAAKEEQRDAGVAAHVSARAGRTDAHRPAADPRRTGRANSRRCPRSRHDHRE